MVTDIARYSVIIPVCNEATILPLTVPHLMVAVAQDDADIIFVCNGCTDDSAEMIRRLTAGRARVLEIAHPSKTAAMNLGDAATAVFPRFYLDADVMVPANGFHPQIQAVQQGNCALVSPAFQFDTRQSSRAARWVSDTWLALPHVQANGFHGMLGVSRQGRSHWNEFPEILADDTFIAAKIPVGQRRIIATVMCSTRPPDRFWAWVAVRARWLRGDRQLRKLGVVLPQNHGQTRVLLSRLLTPATCVPTTLFLCARILAIPLSLIPGKRRWYADRPLATKPSFFRIGHKKRD